MRIAELSGKADAINVCTADLSAGADSIGSAADAVHREVESLKTTMAVHADTNRLDPSYAEKLDMMSGIRAALGALGERPDETAALSEISDGIKANSARIAALEDTINGIGSQLAGVAGKLGTVETAVEQRVGPAPTSLHGGTEKYDVTIGHFGDSARGKAQGPAFSTLTVTYTFSCKADVFLGWVNATVPGFMHDGSTTTNSPDRNFLIFAGDQTMYDVYFDPGNGTGIVYRNNPDFGLTELKAGGTLDFQSSWGQNHTNGTVASGVGNYIVVKHGQTIRGAAVPACLQNAATGIAAGQNYTKAEYGAVALYTVTVAYHSPAENAECPFKRTSGFSTELDKEAQRVLSVRTDTTDRLVNGFEKTLDCSNLPTVVTGVNTEVPGGLALNQHSTIQLLTGSGDREKVVGMFRFNRNGTTTHTGGDLPFTFEGSPLRINGTLAGAASMLVVVDYRTTEDNSCR